MVRIISSIIGVFVVIAILFFGETNPIIILMSLSIASSIIVSELLTAKELIKNYKISIPSMLFAFACPFLSLTDFYLAAIAVYVSYIFIIMLFFHESISFNDINFLLVTTFLVIFCIGSIALSLRLYNYKYNAFFVILTLAIPWMADGGGYFGGTFLGKHKLCPKISPKKTVEGAVFGIFMGVLSAGLIGYVFETFIYHDISINYVLIFTIGVTNALLSIVGDLSFSLIKRSCNIKDYGNIIPGHGGLLDRFDSILFTAPLIFILCSFVPIFNLRT